MRSPALASRLNLFLLVLYFSPLVASAQTSLPPDALRETGCVVDFGSWFTAGIVKAPNNAMFQGEHLCDFYRAAEHMFVWLTSPAPREYGGGRYVLTSPIFYPVSAPKHGYRSFIQRGRAVASADFLSVALSQIGPNGSAVVFDAAGKMHELVHPKWVSAESGASVEIGRTQTRPLGLPLLFDKEGKRIKLNKNSKLFDRHLVEIVPGKETILINGKRYDADQKGNVIDYGTGQADKNVLMTQSGKLVYYGTLVNDVYACFHAANYRPNEAPPDFPTRKEDVEKLGGEFPDGDTLAVLVKTAWIKVRDEEKKEYSKKYLTIDDAQIPTYKKKSRYLWEPDGTESATLALVGMHIAFSAKNQAKMIWATFENVYNTRNSSSYQYWDKGRREKSWDADIKGRSWLFSSSKQSPVNAPRMSLDQEGQIVALGMRKIGPSNIRRVRPWGSELDNKRENTNFININKSVTSQLSDVRRNYIMVGTTWFDQGAPMLANSTMETFNQPSNCTSCHSGARISHIWNHPSTAPEACISHNSD